MITSSVVARPRSARSAPSPPADPWLTRTLWMTAAVGLAAALRLELWYWPGSIFLRVKSGVWSALAWDFAHGALYRPLVSALGYGGTRFMPLLFVTHGLLMRLGLDPVLSGAVLMHASVVAASVALFCALRASAVPATLAAPLALLPWCTIVYQQSCTDLSPDYLAAAAALAAVVCAFGGRSESPSRLALAATLCAVAGLAKLTAVWVAVASIAIPLWVAGRRGAACRVVLITCTVFGIAVAIVQRASDGHFIESVGTTLLGGMTSSDIWHAVPKLVWELSIKPFDLAAPCALAAWCVVRRVQTQALDWVVCYFIAAIGIAVVIFASPGTASNHLVDAQMAATVAIGAAVASGELSPHPATIVYVALATSLAVIAWPLPRVPSVIADVMAVGRPSRFAASEVRMRFVPPGEPYLSMDPMVPVLHDERPTVVEYFMLERAYLAGAPAGRDLESRVRVRQFAAIIVRGGYRCPRDVDAGAAGFDRCRDAFWADQDSALAPLFHAAYEVSAVHKPFVVLRPSPPPQLRQ